MIVSPGVDGSSLTVPSTLLESNRLAFHNY